VALQHTWNQRSESVKLEETHAILAIAAVSLAFKKEFARLGRGKKEYRPELALAEAIHTCNCRRLEHVIRRTMRTVPTEHNLE